MASPRITKSMREGIVKNALEHTFGKAEEKIKEDFRKLADKAYNEKYSKAQQKLMVELGEEFLAKNDRIFVNIRGERHALSMSEERLTDRQSNWHDKAFVPSNKLSDDIYDLLQEKDTLKEKMNQADIQLSAMLETVVSFKKLRAVWPQGEKFFDMYDVDSESKPGVPAVVITELNKVLGL